MSSNEEVAHPHAGPSALAADPVVQNAVSIFVARFHVRRGNEITWATGKHSIEDLTKRGIEWKVLPSGSHLIDHDVIFFDVDDALSLSPSSSSIANQGKTSETSNLVGVAAFINRRVSKSVQTGNGEGQDERGARMLAVGAIVDCGSQRTPWTQLAATLPHICHLERLANALSASEDTDNQSLQEWLQAHQNTSHFSQTSSRDITADGPRYPHDPLLMLPAVTNALGPWLPGILKMLLVAPFRLLIFAPHGAPSLQAASIAFNLGELAHGACQSPSLGAQCPVLGHQAKKDDHERDHGLLIRGIVGLQDITKLQEEVKVSSNESGKIGMPSWIAWTSDRILLEKPDLYDAVLDLSPMMQSQARYSSSPDFAVPTSSPYFHRSFSQVQKGGQTKRVLQRQSWTTREFAVFRGVDEKASVEATTARHSRRAIDRRLSHISSQTPSSSQIQTRDLNVRRPSPSHPSTSTLLAFIRFWLSELWIIPRQWRLNLRESYGYVPLSIRSDGGIRASIMLLPSDDSEESSIAGYDGAADDSAFSSQRLAHHPSSPSMVRRSLDGHGRSGDHREDAIIDDPILAAVGAGSVSSRFRKSRSSTSAHLVSDLASVHEDNMSVRTGIASIQPGQEYNTSSELLQDARDSVRLALCLYVGWSEWLSQLVIGIQDVIQEKVLEKEEQQAENGGNGVLSPTPEDDEAGPSPIKNNSSQVVYEDSIILSSADLGAIGLSSTNLADIDLVRFIASSVSDHTVEVRAGWSLFSWLCW